MTDREQIRRDRIRVAFGLSHHGHDGEPGAPDNSCVRCNAERELDSLLAELEQAEADVLAARTEASNFYGGEIKAMKLEAREAREELRDEQLICEMMKRERDALVVALREFLGKWPYGTAADLQKALDAREEK